MNVLGMKDLCSGQNVCQVPPEVLPCTNEIATVFRCFIDNLSMLCASTSSGNGQGGDQGRNPAARSPADLCGDVTDTAQACARAHDIDLSGDDTSDCSTGNACSDCICRAGDDTTKQSACVSDCAAP